MKLVFGRGRTIACSSGRGPSSRCMQLAVASGVMNVRLCESEQAPQVMRGSSGSGSNHQ